MDPLTAAYELLFYALFGAALVALWRRPNPLTADIALLFGSLAGLFAVQLAVDLWPQLPAWLGQVGLALLLAQPGLALRLTRHLRPLARWVASLTIAGYLASVTAVLAVGTDQPAAVLLAVGYFVIGNGAAAIILGREAVRRAGLARWRLAAAAAAMALMAATILVAAAGGPVASVLARGGVTLSGLAFLLAFLPPRWLRRLGQQAVAYRFVTELAHSRPGIGASSIWQLLADAARALTGAERVDVRLDDTAGAGEAPSGAIGTAVEPVLRVPFSNGSRHGELMLRTAGAARLFAEDDLELLEVLGNRALSAAEREEILAERSALAERLAATNVELSRASAAKSDFLAAMSHELRTPLNAIIGFSELLRTPTASGDPAAADVRQFAGHIHGAGLHLLELINDILDLSRVEAGRLELRHEPIDMVTLVAETLATVRPLAEAKQHELLADMPSALIAEVDPARMRQIAYNLLSNAIKFTPPEGRVSVELVREDERLRLTVSDTGLGIDPDDQPRVFAAFEQVSPGSVEGTGLGLALTRRLVEAHGGQIELDSAPGSGSRFTVRLPLRRLVATHAATVEPDDGDDPLVLVIEDDSDAAELLRLQLRQAGYRVAMAADGESGLTTAHRLCPAAILLDVLLPGLDGWEVLKRLRADPATEAIPVMVISIVDNAALGLALGATDYLVKPVGRETLLAALGRLSLTTKVLEHPVAVLVVDDDPAALALYRSALRPEGFRVIEAATGEEGLERARTERVDAIVLDLLLPGLDGFEVAARLRADSATEDIPILVITGHELSDHDKQRLNQHVRGVLAKGGGAMEGLHAWLDRLQDRSEE